MTQLLNTEQNVDISPNWMRMVNSLAKQAMVRRAPLCLDELRSLAAIAVARARANYRPEKTKCPLGPWVYRWGGKLLLAGIRREMIRRSRSVNAMTFTDVADLAGCCAQDCSLEDHLVAPRDFASGAIEIDEILDTLAHDDREIVILRSQQWTLGKIGGRLGLGREAVRLRLRKIAATLERRANLHV